jgi:hypothetical protein
MQADTVVLAKSTKKPPTQWDSGGHRRAAKPAEVKTPLPSASGRTLTCTEKHQMNRISWHFKVFLISL